MGEGHHSRMLWASAKGPSKFQGADENDIAHAQSFQRQRGSGYVRRVQLKYLSHIST